MSEHENVGIVRHAYDLFGRGDIAGLLGHLADDVTWETPGAPGVPYAGSFRGRDQVARFFEGLGKTADITTFEPREFIAQGDRVAVLGSYRGKGRSTRRPFATDWAMFFTVREGKVTSFHEYFDTANLGAAFSYASRNLFLLMTRARWLTAAGLVIAATLAYGLGVAPAGPRTLRVFDPDRMADLELRMWQAYYAKERVRLFTLLVAMLHEQNRYPWTTATRQAFHLARAAATFGDAREHYEVVLPDLERAYGITKDWVSAGFDPGAVARAELAWWVARRVPGESSPEHVGALMAHAYALLYEAPQSQVANAALLRARAAALRDAQAQQPDWETIGRLLRESYRDLRQSLAAGG